MTVASSPGGGCNACGLSLETTKCHWWSNLSCKIILPMSPVEIIIPILQMGKVKMREAKVTEIEGMDLNPSA